MLIEVQNNGLSDNFSLLYQFKNDETFIICDEIDDDYLTCYSTYFNSK
jgi:hypothetical protein